MGIDAVSKLILHGSNPVPQGKKKITGPRGSQRMVEVFEYVTPGGGTDEDAVLALALSDAPEVGESHPIYTWFTFTDESTSDIEALGPRRARMTITWHQTGNDPGTPLPDLPPTTCREIAGRATRKIARHPKFADANGAWGPGLSLADLYDHSTQAIFASEIIPLEPIDAGGEKYIHPNGGANVPAEVRGMQTFEDCTGTVICTTWSYTEPPDPQDSCGIEDPPNRTGSGGKYLRVGGSNSPDGSFWKQEAIYIKSATPWPAFLYS